jgi:hypothetical protein
MVEKCAIKRGKSVKGSEREKEVERKKKRNGREGSTKNKAEEGKNIRKAFRN